MKLILLIALLILFIITGCEKEDLITAPPPERLNIQPQAFAGADFHVVIPVNYATLHGTYIDTPFDIVHPTWKKISGPNSYDTPNVKIQF